MRLLFYLLLVVIVTASSCATKLKRQVRAYEYFNDHPNELAELCGTKFPPITKYLPGKPIFLPGEVKTIVDSVTITVDCPDGTQVKADCPPNKNTTIRDTIKIVDTIETSNTAIIAAQNYKIVGQQATIDDLTKKKIEADKIVKRKSMQLGIFVTIVVLYLLWRFYNFIRLKTLQKQVLDKLK